MTAHPPGLLVTDAGSHLRVLQELGALDRIRPSLPLPTKVILQEYGGFDGLAWPGGEPVGIDLDRRLAGLKDKERVIGYAQALEAMPACRYRTLLLTWPTEGGGVEEYEGFEYCGVDLGQYEGEECACYSTLLHEVLLGGNSGMRAHASRLNDRLLFRNVDEANAAGRTLRRLLEARIVTNAGMVTSTDCRAPEPIGVYELR